MGDYVGYTWQLFYKPSMLFQEAQCSSKNRREDNLIDTCGIPVGKVQSSLFVAFFRRLLQTSSFFKGTISFI